MSLQLIKIFVVVFYLANTITRVLLLLALWYSFQSKPSYYYDDDYYYYYYYYDDDCYYNNYYYNHYLLLLLFTSSVVIEVHYRLGLKIEDCPRKFSLKSSSFNLGLYCTSMQAWLVSKTLTLNPKLKTLPLSDPSY